MNEGIHVLIGPDTAANSKTVQTISKKLQIPNFQPFSNIDIANDLEENEPVMVFNLFPDKDLPAAFATFVRESNWKSYAALYENEEGLSRLQDVLKSRTPNDMPITLRRMDDRSDYR